MLIAIACGIGIFLRIWCYSLISCEINTLLHKDVIDAYKSYEEYEYWVDGYSFAKIIFYTKYDAMVYYISNGIASVVEYVNDDGKFKPIDVDMALWSLNGNGDSGKIVWPYWYHHPFLQRSFGVAY